MDMLVRKITKEVLYREFPVFEEKAEGYSPKTETVEKIGKRSQRTSVVLFLEAMRTVPVRPFSANVERGASVVFFVKLPP
jgi:hypothetical protein